MSWAELEKIGIRPQSYSYNIHSQYKRMKYTSTIQWKWKIIQTFNKIGVDFHNQIRLFTSTIQ